MRFPQVNFFKGVLTLILSVECLTYMYVFEPQRMPDAHGGRKRASDLLGLELLLQVVVSCLP